MHRKEREEIVTCVDCGSPLDVERERGYSATSEWALCWSCALTRGARFDENEDRWSVPPDLTGLPPIGEEEIR
jgi:hypothetical protein